MSESVFENDVLVDDVELAKALEARELLDWLFHSIADHEVTCRQAPSRGSWGWLKHLRANKKSEELFYAKYLDHTMKRAMADRARGKEDEAVDGKEKVLADEAGIERMVELCQGMKK